MELEQKITELGEVVAAFKKSNDTEFAALKANGHVAQDVKNKTNELNDKITQLQDEIKSIKTAANRNNNGVETETEVKNKEQKDAMNAYLRKGVESKAMSVDSDADGGYLVTPEMSSEIVKKVYESSPLRQLASVVTISSDQFDIIEDLDLAGAAWVGEVGARTETTTPKLNKVSIPVHEMYANPKITQKLLDDASLNMESYLSEKVAQKFALLEATAFISGDGAGKPKGILSYDAGTAFNQVEQVESGTSGAIAPDDMINLIYQTKEAYRKNGTFLMHRQTAKEVRKFKDSQNRYLWAPGLDGNTAGSLLGFNILDANDMELVASGKKAVAFGDFKQGYQIVDRIGIRVLRDPYSAKPYIMFYTTKRVGGGVKDFEAIKLLKIKA